MSSQARVTAVLDSVARPARTCEWPKTTDGKNAYISDIYGTNVFTLKKLQQTLPKTVYARFVQQIKVIDINVGSSTIRSSNC
jgi:glutamine synthetase